MLKTALQWDLYSRKANLCINADLNEICSAFVFVLNQLFVKSSNTYLKLTVIMMKTLAKSSGGTLKRKES